MPSPCQPHCQASAAPYIWSLANCKGCVLPCAHVSTLQKAPRHLVSRLTCVENVYGQMQASAVCCCHGSGFVVDLAGTADLSRFAEPLFRDMGFIRDRQRRGRGRQFGQSPRIPQAQTGGLPV